LLRAETFRDVSGVQFTLQWNPDRLSFLGAEPRGLPGLSSENLGTARAEEGILPVAWTDLEGKPQSLSKGELLMELRYRVKKAGDTEIDFVSEPTPRRAYGGEGPAPLSFNGEEGTLEGQDTPSDFRFAPNYPNPARDVTTFEYALPEQKRVTVTVYNLLGQVVATPVEGSRRAGRHTMTLDVGGLSSGVYMVRFQAGSHIETQEMTVTR
jgi:hypothetical protein